MSNPYTDPRTFPTKPCKDCAKLFTVTNRGYFDKWNFAARVFCSRKCFVESAIGKENKNWKGGKVKYSGLHMWVTESLGAPSRCVSCSRADKVRFEWANKSHGYNRNLSDWIRLCSFCHRYFDGLSKIKPPNYKLPFPKLRYRGNKRDEKGKFIKKVTKSVDVARTIII